MADGVAEPAAERLPLDSDQVRAALGALFFILAVVYIVNAVRDATLAARSG